MSVDYTISSSVEADQLQAAIDHIRKAMPVLEKTHWFSQIDADDGRHSSIYELPFHSRSNILISWKKRGNSRNIQIITAMLYFLLGRMNVIVLSNGDTEIDFFGSYGGDNVRYPTDEILDRFLTTFLDRMPADYPWRLAEADLAAEAAEEQEQE